MKMQIRDYSYYYYLFQILSAYVCVCYLKQHGDHGDHSVQVVLYLSLSLQQCGTMQQQL